MKLPALWQREILLIWRNRHEALLPLFFFLVIASLFPLAISPNPLWLSKLLPGVFMIALILANLLSLPRLFHKDFEEGIIQQWFLHGISVVRIVRIKLSVHILVFLLPILLIAPLLLIMFAVPLRDSFVFAELIAASLPALSALGVFASALTVTLRQGFLLLTLIILPLCTPIIIFACMALEHALQGLPFNGELALLAAISIVCMLFVPFAATLALKAAIR